ncbi:MAG TPA: serine hydrolase domain-containing protein [Bryobacteraceae bacterium]|jgi:CubicO group peptidase (beta-lactamase class C family)|nr:serine hydrolase domain-containing protein [Bryobacteraceae bacterium]
MRRLSFFLFISFLVAPLWAQTDAENKIPAKAEAALKESGAPSVSLAVVEDGKIWAKAFGKANLAQNRAANVSTRYAVGSISKQFTAAAILLLQEQHKISLDDTVAKYFPDLTRAREITVRELLSHTSGYEDYAPQDYLIPAWTKATTPMAVVNRWAKLSLNFDPGTKWQYSNTNFVIAGLMVEKASGQTLLSFLQQKIFTPLDMKSAGFCDEKSPADAGAYTRYALGPAQPVEREAPGWYFGAGELCMTAEDLAKWDTAFLNHKILSARSYKEFTQEVWLKNGDHTNYALGLAIGQFHDIPSISHSGEVMGFLASNTIYPNRKTAVVALSNEVGVNMLWPLVTQISSLLLLPSQPPASNRELQSVRNILEGLQKGKIDPALFTGDAQFYFAKALPDYRSSLAPLGELKSVTRTSESLRGGMTHRAYHATFEKKAVDLNCYVMPDGKYEQFLVEGE